MEIEYRKATEQDIPRIIELWKEFIDFHKARDAFFSRSKEGPENFGKFILENINKDDAIVYVAEANRPMNYLGEKPRPLFMGSGKHHKIEVSI